MLDDLTQKQHTDVFQIEPIPVFSYEKPDNTWLAITVEMNLDLMTYERTIYTMFDLLSDIGGLSSILISLLAIVASAWNHNNFDNMMVAHLFRIKPSQQEGEVETNEPMTGASSYPNCGEYVRSLLPDCCCKPCPRSRK